MRRDLVRCIIATTVLAGVCLFRPSLASAAPKCDGIFSSEYALKGRLEVELSVVDALKPEAYAKRLEEVNALLGPLAPGTDSQITVGKLFMFSSYNPINKEIYIGLRPESWNKKNPEINLNTLSHEYGHAIFEKNLIRDLESYKKFREEFLQMDIIEAKINTAEDRVKSLVYRSDVTFNKVEKENLINQARDVVAEAIFLKKKLADMKSYLAVRGAMHEVFADAVALAVTKDPKAIEKVVRNGRKKYKPHSSDEILLRDMSDGLHHKTENTWNKEVILHTKLGGDIYYALMPARWELWRLSKSRLGGELYRKEFLSKVFSILERNFSEVLAKPVEQIGPVGFREIEKLNKQLIEDFRKEL